MPAVAILVLETGISLGSRASQLRFQARQLRTRPCRPPTEGRGCRFAGQGHQISLPSARRPQPPRGAPKSSGQELAPSPKKIDLAVALLRTLLASGERPAAEVEAKALCAGISPRTYDRARKRLGVTSRRIGFGRWAKYVIALPGRHGTPSEGANMAGAT